MDLDRSHFRTSSTGSSTAASTSELFICFTSRLSSSSSMKLSKSILSPGRARDGGPVSLSSSLSRRLRTNGSLKGGQASPFFTTPGKKRGCAFENPEPSSPKVTCIGQVRVKTKKKVKQSRSLFRRRGGDVSFRKIEQGSGEGGNQNGDKSSGQQQRYSNASAHYQNQPPPQEHRNQRWVHLPISICEGLREFSCLFPCKGSCFSTSERDKSEKQNGAGGNENGCGAVFARWLVSVNDGEGGRRREIELVVGGEDDEGMVERLSMRSSRRHVFEDIEVKDDRIEVKGQSVEGGEEAARVSICIPPKNALLLMRCRSDPMKMAALANRFSWDAHAAANDGNVEEIEEETNELDENEVEDKIFLVRNEVKVEEEVEEDATVSAVEAIEENEVSDEAEADLEIEDVDQYHWEEAREEELVVDNEEMVDEKEPEELLQEIEVNGEEMGEEVVVEEEEEEEEEEEVESNMDSFEALLDQENAEHYEDCPTQQEGDEEAEVNPICRLSPSTESDEETEGNCKVLLFSDEVTPGEEETEQSANAVFMNDAEVNQAEVQLKSDPKETQEGGGGEEEKETTDLPVAASEMENPENQEAVVVKDELPVKENGSPVLPECLLLMMCEPKLSMEVSKETWVCKTDFIRWLPERPVKPAKAQKPGGCDHEPVKRRLSTDSKPKPPLARAPPTERNDQRNLQQPPRSSCSLPMAAVIEQKLVNAVGYEPFVLTRCKSEPMRTSAAKLMPESCFWKNAMRKLEPHRRATIGVGAAGVGF